MTIDDTSVPKSIRRMLAMSPKQEFRPVSLSNWTEELVTESRRNGISNKQIRHWIREYARANNWSNKQIDAVLRDFDSGSYEIRNDWTKGI